jgi:hypothetical protein
VSLAPSDQFAQNWQQVAAAGGDDILVARRTLLVAPPLDEAAAFEALQTLRQDVGRDLFRRREKIGEAVLVVEEQVTQDDQRPGVAEDVQRARDGAPGAKLAEHGPDCTMSLAICN